MKKFLILLTALAPSISVVLSGTEVQAQPVASPSQSYNYWRPGEPIPLYYPYYNGLGGKDTMVAESRGNIMRGGADIDTFVVRKDKQHQHQMGDLPDIFSDFNKYDPTNPDAEHEVMYLEGYENDFADVGDIPIDGYAKGTVVRLPDRHLYFPFIAPNQFIASKYLKLGKYQK